MAVFSEPALSTPAGTLVPHVATDDIDASLKKVPANGGSAFVPMIEIPGIGHFAVFTDPTGNNIGLYTGSDSEE